MSKQILGRRGEDLAREYLCKHGHTIVCCNYRTRRGEIDIITLKDRMITFVEVKYRTDLAQGHPAEAITPSKLNKFKIAVLEYLQNENVPEHTELRFTAVTILELPGQPPLIECFEHILGP